MRIGSMYKRKQYNHLGPGAALLACKAISWLSACSVLPPAKPQEITHYRLEPHLATTAAVVTPVAGPVILVGATEANAALNTPRMSYVRDHQTLSYFARSHWVDTPPSMLRPLLTQALENQSGFGAVVQSSGAVGTDLRLDTELLDFAQVFTVKPSEFRIGLRAQLVDVRQRKVLATRTFAVRQPAPTENPLGGAVAASQALEKLLPELADFCAKNAVPVQYAPELVQ